MPRLRGATVLAIGVALPACPADGWLHFGTDSEPTSTGPAPTEPPPTTTAEPVVTTTVVPDDTSSGPSTAEGTTAAPPLPPPAILTVDLEPPVLVAPGAVALTVTAEYADEVRLQLDGAPEIALAEGPPGVFTDHLGFYGSLANGTHTLEFTPWRLDATGAVEPREIVVDLPKAGGEDFWEAIDALGEGSADALIVLPNGDLVEFGTLTAGPRCYLRRRAPTGAWTMADVQILSEKPCRAIDLSLDADGALYLLADRTGDGALSWWLGRTPQLGAPLENLRFGAPGEVATALAMNPDSAAVCGTQPTKKIDVSDAAAWIYNLNAPGSALTFDYRPAQLKHTFRETPYDCAFASETLVLIGESYGQQDLIDPNSPWLKRLFLLEYDTGSQITKWTIDGQPKDLTQSTGTSITIDDKGRYITGGYHCGLMCDPTAELRRFAPGGTQQWQLDLAPPLKAPHRLAWSPAGYVVLVSSVMKDQWTADYYVQAWKPGQYPALWSYEKNVAPPIHIALTVAIGAFGQIYTGGIGANNFPAVAFIHG